ncbi:cell division protein SepF [Thermosediminibacter litoriperuensis]|uniref:Cell division protein SepF n=1 Tax=Thermosediminibacter litoriperuensis TaxID=291989 RepID=A0A5S5AV75_9FIRM|nr:cell division protein SepF [Thermosediminibacter litoriperuensis]TYP54906.1 cell division inhibitor SepF [Thermosediminibacter litoriperuensis]
MANNRLFNKILYFLGIEDEDPAVHQPEESLHIPVRPERGRIINIHQAPKNRVVVFKPSCFDEVREISEELKSRRAVIVNLEGLDKEAARRILDFLSGSVFVLDGTVKKVGSGTFVFAPNNVDISGLNMDEGETGREKPLFTVR